MRTRFLNWAAFSAVAWVAGLVGCGDLAHPGSPAKRDQVHAQAMAALADFKQTDPSLTGSIDKAYAYAIFPKVIMAGIGLGGAHGNGEVYQNGKMIGYVDMSQASIGAQLGGQKFAELILFQNQSALMDLQGGVEFDAKATAVAAKAGAGRAADYQRGVMVFILPEGGLMAQAVVGGQKFRYTPVGG